MTGSLMTGSTVPMLWVYGHYKYCNSFIAGTVFIWQILTHESGPHTERVEVKICKYLCSN